MQQGLALKQKMARNAHIMIVTILLAHVYAIDLVADRIAHNQDSFDVFVDKAFVKLFNRGLELSALHRADMDSTMLAKTYLDRSHSTPYATCARPGHLAIAPRMNMNPGTPLHAFHSGVPELCKASFLQQPRRGAMHGHLLQARAEEGYKFGDFTKKTLEKAKEAITEAGKQATGDKDYKIGDITKGAAKRATSDSEKMKKAADAAGKVILEDEKYEFGDITKGMLKGAKGMMEKAKKAIDDQKEGTDESQELGEPRQFHTPSPIQDDPAQGTEEQTQENQGKSDERNVHVHEVTSSEPNVDTPGGNVFDLETAVLLSGFAFEAYNEPMEDDARWEKGADGTDVAFMSEVFATECYAGRLEVLLLEAKDLPAEAQTAEKLLTGDEPDPYVVFALNEEATEGPKEGAMALARAVDRARSSTRWAREAPEGGEKGAASWGEEERFFLYVKDPRSAELALTVFDEDLLKDDDPLGAASVKLSSLLEFNGTEANRSWSGWVPLSWRPEQTQDNAVMMGTVAGAMVAGPVGAAAGGFIGSLIKKPVQGEVRIALKYTPFEASATVGAVPEDSSERKAPETQSSQEAGTGLKLASGVAPRGGSEGIDWSELVKYVGIKGADQYELLCFVSHEESSTQAAMWRDRSRRRIVLSFRGTSDMQDALTDVKLQQVPLEEREDGKKSDDERMVHGGFKASSTSINRRLKELLVSACIGTPGEWEVLITGHSLGGALATLLATEIASGVDASRSLKTRDDNSWFAQLVRTAQEKLGQEEAAQSPIQLGRVRLYTFGAPRVGNSLFASYYDSLGIDTFRIVNGADIVPRMPRHSNSAGVILDYEHVGLTVLISDGNEGSPEVPDGFWIEGESDAKCPLRDVSPFTNPFGPKTIIGDLGQTMTGTASAAWSKINSTDVRSAALSLLEAAAELDKGKGDIESRIRQVAQKPLEAVSVLGLDSKFVESELAMLDSMTRGTFVEHHLEPSYFAAMKNALGASPGNGGERDT